MAFFRPNDLISYLRNEQVAIRTVYGLGLGTAFVAGSIAGWVLPLFLSISRDDLASIILSTPFMAVILAAVGNMSSPTNLQLNSIRLLGFWFAVSQIAVTPLLMISWSVVAAFPSPVDGSITTLQYGLLFLLIGICSGRMLSVIVIVRQRQGIGFDWRWWLVLILPLVGGLLWLIPQAYGTYWLAFSIVAFGVALVQLRLAWWLWQAVWVWSLKLMAPAAENKIVHIVPRFDQLRLLPLPETTSTLRQMMHTHPRRAGLWLIELFNHPADRWIVRRFVNKLPLNQAGHAFVFWLSVHRDGKAVLMNSGAPLRQPADLVAAYAQLSHVPAPGAWRDVLARHIPTIRSVPLPTELQSILLLLTSAQIVLEARQWGYVEQQMIALLNLPPASTYSVTQLLAPLQQHVEATLSAELTTFANVWPIVLLDVMAEQMIFLQGFT